MPDKQTSYCLLGKEITLKKTEMKKCGNLNATSENSEIGHP